MSPVVLGLDLLLVSLLVLTLVLGMRLNGRLKGLKQSHAGFEKAVAELNQAAARAEAGLAALRETSAEAHDALLARIDTARALTTRLERATFQAEKAAEAVVKAKGELSAPGLSRAEVAASRAQMSPPETSSVSQISGVPHLSTVPMSSSLATIAALVGDAPRADARSASPLRPASPVPTSGMGSTRRGRSTFDEDLFEGGDAADAPRPASASASGARLLGLRGRSKDDRP
jgi:hypothetical protein